MTLEVPFDLMMALVMMTMNQSTMMVVMNWACSLIPLVTCPKLEDQTMSFPRWDDPEGEDLNHAIFLTRQSLIQY